MEVTYERAKRERNKGWSDRSIADDWLAKAIEWDSANGAENINVDGARDCYLVETIWVDPNYVTHSGGYELTYNDETFTTTKTPITEPKSNDEIAEYHKGLAKTLRDDIIESNIEVHGVFWQVHVTRDEPRLNRAINTSTCDSMPGETTCEWILADNTLRPTTAAELKQVIVAKGYREGEVFAKYSIWRSGDMLTPFSPLEA